MKPTATLIERWLDDVEARLVPPERPLLLKLPVVYEAKDKEKALARLAASDPDRFAGRTVEDINWSDDLEAIKAKAYAEHIAAHPEDAGRPVGRTIGYVIVLEPQEVELATEEAEVEAKKIEDDIVVPADASDKDAAVSETPPALNVLSFDCSARSKPWRPVHQRPTRDQRRPTWKKWER